MFTFSTECTICFSGLINGHNFWTFHTRFLVGILLKQKVTYAGFPLGLENLEKWEGIFQSGKSPGILNRLEKSGKTTQNTGKLRKFQKKVICYFSMIFK